ncbi:ABC transporter permease, partial [Candidatus Sumerlaeota bacterium]|nr:ABC transporter permease [Candidatus Sumerlaeota bacterium]
STAIIAGSGGLIKKVVFPAAILPMQAIVASFVNLTITLLLLGVFLAVIGLFPGLWFAMVVPLMALQFILVVGACYLFSTINVFFRDMAPILGACLNFLFWLTPIVYPARLITDRVHKVEYLFLINPVAHLVRLYRQALYRYSSEVPCSVGASIAYLLCLGALAYVIGKYVFTRSQSHLADEV